VPKKTQRRPARSKSQRRHPAPRPNGATAHEETEVATTTVVAQPAPARAATTVSSAASAAARRSAQSSRRTAVTAINYAYLRHDLVSLAVLAPAMVVLVIVAYVFVH